jgi:hypothetical protein
MRQKTNFMQLTLLFGLSIAVTIYLVDGLDAINQ